MLKPEYKEKKERTYKVHPENRKIYVRINHRSQIKVPLFMDNTKGKRMKAVYIGNDMVKCTTTRDSDTEREYSTIISISPTMRKVLGMQKNEWFEIMIIDDGYMLRKATAEELDFE